MSVRVESDDGYGYVYVPEEREFEQLVERVEKLEAIVDTHTKTHSSTAKALEHISGSIANIQGCIEQLIRLGRGKR